MQKSVSHQMAVDKNKKQSREHFINKVTTLNEN